MSAWSSSELSSVPAAIRASAEKSPDKTAVILDGEAVTYAELLQRSTAFASSLLDLGVGPGDVLGAFSSNCTEMLYSWIGASMLGAVFLPVNTDYRGEFLRHQFATAEAKVVFVQPDLAGELAAVLPQVPSINHVVIGSGGGDAVSDLTSARPGLVTHAAGDLLSGAATLPSNIADPRGDAIGAVIFTAGTTGPSKGVAMSQNYLVRSAGQVFDLRGCTPESVVYGTLPLFHLAAISVVVLGPLVGGATAALDSRFSATGFWDRTRALGADEIIILGPMVVMLWNQPEREDDHDNPVRFAIAAPMPEQIHVPFQQRFGLTVLQMYAQSEVYPLTITSHDNPAPPGSSGSVNPLFDMKLLDENEAEVPTGEVGEVCVRPNEPHVMFEGYYNNPAATLAVWRNLWMHTGDLGRVDGDGFFRFVDRKKDYLRRRGENISSFELETVVSGYPHVTEAAIVAAPSEVTEDEVVAVVAVAEGEGFDQAAFMDYCVANIPHFAVPRYVWVIDRLPRNPVGRVEKYKLRATLAESGPAAVAGVWDREAAGYLIDRKDVRRRL